MSENSLGKDKTSFTERVDLPVLYDVRENWQEIPEVPLAYRDPENIITDSSLLRWDKEIKTIDRMGLIHFTELSKYKRPILSRELFEIKNKLHFLNRSNAEAGMKSIANDINLNFDPKDTLIFLDRGSTSFFYDLVKNSLRDFGTTKEKGRTGDMEVILPAKFMHKRPEDAQTLLYIDDWVLTGQQLGQVIVPLLNDKNQLFTYHLVMSDRGNYIYNKFGLNGKCVYKIVGNDKPDNLFGEFPIYGFHKIPDVLPTIFADSAKSHYPEYSIFPDINGNRIGRHSRLVDY